MALEARIRELDSRHRDLDVEIATEERRPSKDDALLQALKRQKLKMKDEINALQSRLDH